jgi:hypothetical protein
MFDQMMVLLMVLVGSLTLAVLVARGLLELVLTGMAGGASRDGVVETHVSGVDIRPNPSTLMPDAAAVDGNRRIVA